MIKCGPYTHEILIQVSSPYIYVYTCMALMADAVLATAPRMLAIMTASDVMVCRLQFTTTGSKLVIDEFDAGIFEVSIKPPHVPPADGLDDWSK